MTKIYIRYDNVSELITAVSLNDDLPTISGETKDWTDNILAYYDKDAWKYKEGSAPATLESSVDPYIHAYEDPTYYFIIEDSTGNIVQDENGAWLKSLQDDLTADTGESKVNTTDSAPFYAPKHWKWNGSTFENKNLKKYQIYNYIDEAVQPQTDEYQAPKSLNYIISLEKKLFPKRTFVDGALIEVEWFENHNLETDTYDTPVIKVEISYNYDNDDFVTDRTVTRKWAYEDETYPTDSEEWKLTYKHYNTKEAIDEGMRRRSNITNELKGDIIGMISITESVSATIAIDKGTTFFNSIETSITRYKETNYRTDATLEDGILDEIDNADLQTHDWLDNDLTLLGLPGVTIAQFMKNKLDYSTS